ncbi:exodeoxyribonuclease VII large subunit [Actinospongicola halichondriae]|uniref:exodeoxyribonuclease VII large subunit n=1 Tax=Actinospongicola halichondriae TaxID=3236844 RepID=UPI003D462BAD
MAEPSPTFSVSELADTIGARLRSAFPDEIWVRGEILNLSRAPSGHVYFSLADDGGGPDNVGGPAQLSVMLRSRDKERVNRLLMKAGGNVRMTDGTDVRIRGRLDWYAPRGQLQFRMVSIDPAFTLGQLAAARAELLERLRAEGLIGRNRSIPMPLLPLRIGVVTSSGSAAEADVLDELDRSGFAFHVRVADVRVQGPEAAGSIAGAIRWFADRDAAAAYDVLIVARGGGATTDLAAFDHELVARAVAESPIPVITGVGHETDRTVVDDVGHTAAKTPTAAAQVVVSIVAAARDRAEATFASIVAIADGSLRREAEHLDRLAARASTGAIGATRTEQSRIGHLAERLARASSTRLDRGLGVLDGCDRRLRSASRRAVDDAERRLAHLAGRTAAVDPVRALARGWSITRTADGSVLRSAADAPPGSDLVTTLADGTVRSTVGPSDGDTT